VRRRWNGPQIGRQHLYCKKAPMRVSRLIYGGPSGHSRSCGVTGAGRHALVNLLEPDVLGFAPWEQLVRFDRPEDATLRRGNPLNRRPLTAALSNRPAASNDRGSQVEACARACGGPTKCVERARRGSARVPPAAFRRRVVAASGRSSQRGGGSIKPRRRPVFSDASALLSTGVIELQDALP
jgi:hypothetical protein